MSESTPTEPTEKGFAIPRQECERRAAAGEGIREYDLPVDPDLHAMLETAHADITGIGMRVNQGTYYKEVIVGREGRVKTYPSDIEFDELKHPAERKEHVVSTLTAIIIGQLQTSLTDTKPYGAPVAYLQSGEETFLDIKQQELKEKRVRAEKHELSENEGQRQALKEWLEHDVSERVTEYMRTLKIGDTTPFATNTFKVSRTYTNNPNRLALLIKKS